MVYLKSARYVESWDLYVIFLSVAKKINSERSHKQNSCKRVVKKRKMAS